jgi:cell division protein FtsN
MNREYNAQAKRKRPTTTSPPWVWFLAGLLVGGLVVGLSCLKSGPKPQQQTQQQLSKKSPAKVAEKPKVEQPPKPRFDFYTVLPEMEVMIPEEEIKQPPKIDTTTPDTSKDEAAAVYLLQIGSYSNYKDADRIKANLGMLGVQADIQSVSIDSKKGGTKTYHRVRSGPYSRNQVHTINETLKGQQIKSMVIRIKK